MGNGRKSGLFKGSKNNVKNGKSSLAKKIKQLTVKAKKSGYTIKDATITTDGQADALSKWFNELDKYQKAMGESEDTINAAGGSVEIHHFDDKKVGGDSGSDGTIRMADNWVEKDASKDTLPHEHTHNLVDSLIVKELEFDRGTPEFNAARRQAVIYQSINAAALEKYKKYELTKLRAEANKNVEQMIALDKSRGLSSPSVIAYDKQRGEDWFNERKADLEHSLSSTYGAASLSGMRSYATRDYSWAPAGAGIEIPTVASEMFVKVGYNWSALKKSSPFAYFVLRELRNRLNK